MEQAIGRVHEAMDGVLAAWEAEHPDLPVYTREPRPPAWHPDPHQAPVTTRQWAEVIRLRAEDLRQQALHAREQAKQVHQATRALVALRQRPPEDHAGEFTWVSSTILAPPNQRHRR
jgi:hypothetical protein